MKNNLLVIIQARVTSTRLPSKVTLPLCDSTVLEVMLKRIPKFKPNIVIATTDDGSEAPIVEICEKNNVPYHRGSTDNVLERYRDAATINGADENSTIVRLTSDCPVIDQDILERTINFHFSGDYDYTSNVVERTFPRGLDCEIFPFKNLELAWKNATTNFEKEHVTPYIFEMAKKNDRIGSYKDKVDNSNYRITVDEISDYQLVQEIYKEFECNVDFSYSELISLLKRKPELAEINAHVEQKKN